MGPLSCREANAIEFVFLIGVLATAASAHPHVPPVSEFGHRLACPEELESGSDPSAAPRGEITPYSVQMHVHGSFSEGLASMSYHAREAANAGVDVVWWSDHDIWTSHYHLISTFAFEDWCEDLDENEPWRANQESERNENKCWELYEDEGLETHTAEISGEQVYEGARSLRMEGKSLAGEFTPFTYGFKKKRAKRPLLSDVTLELAIYPDAAGPNARPIIDVGLSVHPSNATEAVGQYRVHYYLNNFDDGPYREGTTYYVPLPFVEDDWNVYTLPVTQDAVTGFPFVDGRDNALYEVQVGVESRNSGRAVAFFDDYRILNVLTGDPLFGAKEDLMEASPGGYTDVTHLQGAEVGIPTVHLNEFTVGTLLPDWDLIAALSGFTDETGYIYDQAGYEAFAVDYLVQTAHERGGLISLNHMFGVGGPGSILETTPEELAAQLIAEQAYGVDIMEVGYRDRAGALLADYFWVWDELSKAGIFLVGTGVNDFHGSFGENTWLTNTNNFVSWIYAAGSTKEQLLDGLKRGRTYFGDIALFDGTMDLTNPQGHAMGQIIITDKDVAEVTLRVSGLAPGDEIRLIESGSHTQTFDAQGSDFEWTGAVAIDPEAGTFVRFEIYGTSSCPASIAPPEDEAECLCMDHHDHALKDKNDQRRSMDPRAGGCAKVFSNPIYLLRQAPENGLIPHKAAIDLGGIFSTSIESFHLSEASVLHDTGTVLTVSGNADQGSITFDTSAVGGVVEVQFTNLIGTWQAMNDLLTLSELSGEGSVSIRFARPSCEGDANSDGLVDPLDYGFVLAQLGCIVGAGDSMCDAADQNHDGIVDPLDVGAVQTLFGTCQ